MKRIPFPGGGGEEFIKLLKAMAEDRDNKKNSTPVGKISDDLVALHDKMEKAHDYLAEDMQLRLEQLAVQAKRQVDEEFHDQQQEAQQMHDNFWSGIYRELKLDPDKNYSYDPKTKTVSIEGEDFPDVDPRFLQ
jgi:hypothetical protein